jgi:hypothetical protein
MCSEFRGVLTCLAADIAKTAVTSQAKTLEIIGDLVDFNSINEKLPSVVSISCSASAVNCIGTPAAFSSCVCVASIPVFPSVISPTVNHSVAAATMNSTSFNCASFALDLTSNRAACVVGHLGGPVWSALWLFLIVMAVVLLMAKSFSMCKRWCKNRRAAYLPVVPEPIIMVSKILLLFLLYA